MAHAFPRRRWSVARKGETKTGLKQNHTVIILSPDIQYGSKHKERISQTCSPQSSHHTLFSSQDGVHRKSKPHRVCHSDPIIPVTQSLLIHQDEGHILHLHFIIMQNSLIIPMITVILSLLVTIFGGLINMLWARWLSPKTADVESPDGLLELRN